MMNFGDLTYITKMVQMLACSEENFRVIYNVYGSAEDCQTKSNTNFDNPLGQYNRLEFLSASSFYQYCEAYLPICPDGTMEITSHSYCPTKNGTTAIIGTFIYRGTLITSPKSLEQVYDDKENVKIEKLKEKSQDKSSTLSQQGLSLCENVLQERVMSIDEWTPGYFSSQITFQYPTEHISNLHNTSSSSSSSSPQLLLDPSLSPLTDDMKGIGEYLCNLSEDPLKKKKSTLPCNQHVKEEMNKEEDSTNPTCLPFRCIGTMVLLFNENGKIVCMEYHHKFVSEIEK